MKISSILFLSTELHKAGRDLSVFQPVTHLRASMTQETFANLNKKPLHLPMLIAKHTKQGDRQKRKNSTHEINIHKTYFFLYSECKLSMATLTQNSSGCIWDALQKI